MNYYVLLGVAQDADPDTIRSAFRALARRYHPDAGSGSSADRFRQILTAYETLNDPNRRGHYDRSLQKRRLPNAWIVERLGAHAAPEPMLRRGSGGVPTISQDERFWPERNNDLIDEVLQLWEELCVGEIRLR
jgi:curved DNA-binding protein CbpA